jgi:hypothetical protein
VKIHLRLPVTAAFAPDILAGANLIACCLAIVMAALGGRNVAKAAA